MNRQGIILAALILTISCLPHAAAARGFGDNDTSKYFSSDSANRGTAEAGMVERSVARMPVGSGEHWVSWLEFNTADMQASADFFSAVFGWEIMPFMDNYSMWMPSMDKGVLGCGLAQGEGFGQQGLFYIYAPDIDAKLAEIEAAGGTTVMPRMPIADGMPNFAVYMDVSGVLVGLVDQAMPAEPVSYPMGQGASGVPGQFCAIEVYNSDEASTSRFYRELFGWDTQHTMDQYMAWNSGAGIAGVFQSHTPDLPVMAYIWSDDVQATLDAVTAAGGTTFGDAMAMEGMGNFGYFTDPGGLVLGLIGPE